MARTGLLSGLLFFSGISALIFETLWLRLSGLAFGNSVWSAALILSSFMAGLALGNGIAFTLKLRRVAPLRLYALLEVAVAFFGCTIVFGLPLLGEWMRPLFQALWDHYAILHGIRFLISFVILLVPTTAMGLSLPVLLEDSLLRRNEFGRSIGLLYGANTLGAVFGAILGEVCLVRVLGIWGTGLFAGLLNCLVAAIAWKVAGNNVASPETGEHQTSGPHSRLLLPLRLLIISFGTGAVLLCLEVVWFRFLRLYVASSSIAFSLMLATVLSGIGAGGIAAGAAHRHAARLRRFIPLLLMAAALSTLLSYVFFPGPALQKSVDAYYLDSWWEIGILSAALMFPSAFLSGLLFPSIVARVRTSLQSPMNSTGITTLFNTGGAAVGPLLAGFVLLPAFGFQASLVLCAVTYALLALLAAERGTWSFKDPLGRATLGLSCVFVLVLVIFPYSRHEAHLANARRPFEHDNERLVRQVEGTADTMQLLRRDFLGEPYYYRLLTNGFSMSATHPRSQRYMRLFAYLPLTFRPESEEALLICYGLGATADALVRHSNLKQVDVVDISKEVFDLAACDPNPAHSNPLRDGRVKTHVQDGRFFLQTTPRQYDIITGEPPPPKVSGAVNLYTEKFFSLMRDRLKEGGIATFWLPIYQLKVQEIKSILKAFHNVFENASVWGSSDEEWIMMGIRNTPRRITEAELGRLWTEEGTRIDLARIGIEVPEQFAALFLMSSDEIARITEGVEPLTDFYPKRLTDEPADLQAVHDFAASYMSASSANRRFRASQLMSSIWPETKRTLLDPFFVIREARYFSGIKGGNRFAELDLYLRGSKLRSPVLEALGSDEFRVAIAERVASKAQNPPAEALPDLAAGALARRDFEAAIQFLEVHRADGAAGREELLLLTYLYCLTGRVEKAEAIASGLGSISRDSFADWLWGKLQAEFGFRPPR